MNGMQQTDYYAVLGLTSNASSNDIRKAFKKLAHKYHPDHNHDNVEESTAKFQIVLAAYEVLQDPETRAKYDTTYKRATHKAFFASAQRTTDGKSRSRPPENPTSAGAGTKGPGYGPRSNKSPPNSNSQWKTANGGMKNEATPPPVFNQYGESSKGRGRRGTGNGHESTRNPEQRENVRAPKKTDQSNQNGAQMPNISDDIPIDPAKNTGEPPEIPVDRAGSTSEPPRYSAPTHDPAASPSPQFRSAGGVHVEEVDMKDVDQEDKPEDPGSTGFQATVEDTMEDSGASLSDFGAPRSAAPEGSGSTPSVYPNNTFPVGGHASETNSDKEHDGQPVIIPNPPKAPQLPSEVGASSSELNEYIENFDRYMKHWEMFVGWVNEYCTKKMSYMMQSRDPVGYACLGPRGNDEVSGYYAWIREHNAFLRWWTESREEHDNQFMEFMKFMICNGFASLSNSFLPH